MRFLRAFGWTFGAVLVLGVVFLGGYLLGDRMGQRAAAQAPGLDVVYRVRDLLNQEFYGDAPTAQAQAYAAASGLTQSYNDPFTRFIEPAPRKLEKAELQGQFGGIGALIGRNAAGEAVLTPNRDSPAMQAGIQAADVLVAVNDKPIQPEMSVNDIVLLVRGDIGTKVKLTIRRAGQANTLDVTVVRQRIETPSVDWRVLDASNHVGYVRISIFSERTAQELRTGIDDLNKRGVDKLVLDLRGDGGGLLDAAIDTASQFLRDGTVLYEVRRGGAEKSYPVKTTSSPAQS
ncbi:MAG TPA: S41 family peptidase, partial [Anaerolineae bacterium]